MHANKQTKTAICLCPRLPSGRGLIQPPVRGGDNARVLGNRALELALRSRARVLATDRGSRAATTLRPGVGVCVTGRRWTTNERRQASDRSSDDRHPFARRWRDPARSPTTTATTTTHLERGGVALARGGVVGERLRARGVELVLVTRVVAVLH